MTGALDVIEHPARGPRQPLLRAAAGDVRCPRPCLADRHARLQAAARVRLPAVGRRGGARRRASRPRTSTAVEIEAGWLTCEMEELGRGPDLTPIRVNFSATLTAAIALLAGRFTPAELAPEWLGRARGGDPRPRGEDQPRARSGADREDAARHVGGWCVPGPRAARPAAPSPPARRRQHGRGQSRPGAGPGARRRSLAAPRSRPFRCAGASAATAATSASTGSTPRRCG